MPEGTVAVLVPDDVAPASSGPTERELTGNRNPFWLVEFER